ncbi:uncharacterized protein METZ01_LOCUS144953 [marine metagenome]|uniref:Uncharacterized protein n=1 Tax=marine metagenome TaxID=408172 RepID=A0A381ZSC3_9ZZZZ
MTDPVFIDPFRVGLAHVNAPEIPEKAKAVFKNLCADKVISTEIGPALAIHAGPGALVIAVQNLYDGFNG